MRPNRTYIKWKGRVFPGYRISTGLNQGSPWFGLAFALAVDHFVRFAMDKIPWELPVERWILFADDMIDYLGSLCGTRGCHWHGYRDQDQDTSDRLGDSG
eukprot:2025336-Amphidinium_carterae.2